MPLAQVWLLGGLAGATIFLGLPVARSGWLQRATGFATALSVGILLFLLFDILRQAREPISAALASGHRDLATAYGLSLALILGMGVGLLSLSAFQHTFLNHGKGRNESTPALPRTLWGPRLAMLIAVGVGLHNFSEGLAIGQSAGAGQLHLAWMLVLGFGLHNVTEAFGIISPLSGAGTPSWRLLATLGAVAGLPTVVGTVIGSVAVSPLLSVVFLALAAGAIIFIVGELFHVARRAGAHATVTFGIFLGFAAAFVADLVLTVAGV